ncbi:MAG: Heme exporter protein [Rickettsiaceae bacterium]|jgi:heme exporter protein A|nr:Heme exporter protein [Rickettsiaceae bacterium]
MILTLENISLNAHNSVLFSDISFTLLSGSVTILRGANGVGKTTLLRMIAGIVKPTTGKILINNTDVNQIAKPYVNYIGHNLAIKHELTVLENIQRAAESYNSLERVGAAIHYFGLKDVAFEKCYKLSAGNQKKVALSRLLACNAKIWLLDEAETNLDEENKKLLANCIYSQTANGGIIISTTHIKENAYIKGQEIRLGDFVK